MPANANKQLYFFMCLAIVFLSRKMTSTSLMLVNGVVVVQSRLSRKSTSKAAAGVIAVHQIKAPGTQWVSCAALKRMQRV
jgi:hypothetical protein